MRDSGPVRPLVWRLRGAPGFGQVAIDVRIAHTLGEHVWHVREDTDEFFLVLHGEFPRLPAGADGQECNVVLRQGDTFIVLRAIPSTSRPRRAARS